MAGLSAAAATLSQPLHGAAAALAPFCRFHASSFGSPRSLAFKSAVLPCTHRQNDSISGNEQRLWPAHSSFPSSPALVSSVDDLFGFICNGPLMRKLDFTVEKVAESIDKWILYGGYLCRLFRMNELTMSIPEKARIYHYYIPVFLWCEEQIQCHRSKFSEGDEIQPLVIGVGAPKEAERPRLFLLLIIFFGALVVLSPDLQWRADMTRSPRNAATLSVDDFYLTTEEQAKLRSRNPGNALLEFRGNAGSHDLPFSVETLSTLSKLTKKGMKAKLPRYDKHMEGGVTELILQHGQRLKGLLRLFYLKAGCLASNLFQKMKSKRLTHSLKW